MGSPGLTSPVIPATNRRGASIGALLASLRPHQWSKNLFVFAGLVFGQRLGEADAVLRAVETFVIFCALSGAVYLHNDVHDRASDRQHPLKRMRPIASGALPVPAALAAALALAAAGLAAAWTLSAPVALTAAAYVALLVSYSTWLKHVVILDALVIAGGFVLRTVAGVLVVGVPMSSWLLLCTTLLALFIALAKRRHELTLLAEGATDHRRTLGDYTPYLLDQMTAVVGAATLIAYCLYAVSPDTAERLHTPLMGLTIPFVLYGLLRYLFLVHRRDGGGSPETLLFADRPLLVCVAGWSVSVAAILYWAQ